jgi:RNA polymerase sigma-70 factor (ECF subfamily)
MSILITEKLLNDLKEGNENAFNIIFNNYFARLCQFAITYVIDEAAAKNIVQDVFVKLWENRKNIRGNTSFLSYMLTITKNYSLDYLKHKQIEYKYQKRAADYQSELELNYYALQRLEVDLLEYEEIVQIIEKTLNTLPPQCQQVFRLSRLENLSHAEIASKLGIGQKAVEANITRAIKVFRKELKDYIPILILLNIPLI